jgi:cell division protein FtsN
LNQPVNKKEIALKKDKSNSKQPEKVPKKEGAKEEKINTAAKTETRISNKIYFDGTYYYVQISSWPSKVKAEGEVRRLKSAGMKPFIVEAYLPQKGGTWYRVRAGSFKSEKEAQDFINKNNI